MVWLKLQKSLVRHPNRVDLIFQVYVQIRRFRKIERAIRRAARIRIRMEAFVHAVYYTNAAKFGEIRVSVVEILI